MAGTAKKRTAKVWTKEEILYDWEKALNKSLGKKKLDPTIAAQFTPPLLVKIQTRLATGADYNKEGAGTRAVAKTLGQICKMLTPGTLVSLAVFEGAFKLCKLHPKCPGLGGGGGMWCDI